MNFSMISFHDNGGEICKFSFIIFIICRHYYERVISKLNLGVMSGQ